MENENKSERWVWTERLFLTVLGVGVLVAGAVLVLVAMAAGAVLTWRKSAVAGAVLVVLGLALWAYGGSLGAWCVPDATAFHGGFAGDFGREPSLLECFALTRS